MATQLDEMTDYALMNRVKASERAEVRDRRQAWGILVVVGLVLGTVVLHLAVPGIVPTGADPGNWLAMARERLGEDIMSAAVSYPPLFSVLLSLLVAILGPIESIVAAGLAAKVALVIAVYLVARPMGPAAGGLAALLVGVAGAQLEAYAWGAYPQLLGSSLAVLSVFVIVRYLSTKNAAHLAFGVVLAWLAVLTHLLAGGLMVFVLPVALLQWLWLRDERFEVWKRAISATLIVAVPAGLYLAYATIVSSGSGYDPVINPLELDRLTALTETFRDAPLLWIVVVVFAGLGLAFRDRNAELLLAAKVSSVAWTVVGGVFFLATGEPRALLLSQVGLLVLAVAGFRELLASERARARAEHARRRFSFNGSRLLIVLGLATVAGLVVGGLSEYDSSIGWYRTVDRSELRGLDVMMENASEGDLSIASAGSNGQPLGWWVEGYAGISTFTGVDTRWLTFPEEREQAEIANAIFSGELSDQEARSQIAEIGADFLVVDRRGPNAEWLSTGIAASFPAIYDSATIVVLDVP